MAEEPAQPIHQAVAADSRKVSESAKHLEKSADDVARTTSEMGDSADRRTELAADRTVLAAERTYAAWVRTGLAALASGVGARTLLVPLLPLWFGKLTGSVLIGFSIFCFIVAVWREAKPGAPPPKPDTRRVPGAILVVVNGFLVFVGVVVLVAIWLPS